MKKKFLALVMTLSMVLSLVPMTALAAEDGTATAIQEGQSVAADATGNSTESDAATSGSPGEDQNPGGNDTGDSGNSDGDTGNKNPGETESGGSFTPGTEGSGSTSSGGGTEGGSTTEPTKPATPKKAAKIGDKEYPTVADAIAAADGNEPIVLLRDVTENITINKSLTLDLSKFTLTGDAEAAVVTISGDKSQVTVQNGTITGGRNPQNGGGFAIDSAVVRLEDLTITGNETVGGDSNGEVGGGGIFALHADVSMQNVTVSENSVTESRSDGGGILVRYGSLTMDGCHVEGNTAPDCGGGMILRHSELNAANSFFENNKAKQGAGIYFNDASGDAEEGCSGKHEHLITDSTISGNIASNIGGGMYVGTTSNLTLRKSKLLKNDGASQGGAIVAYSAGTIELYGVSISENTAASGAGILALGTVTCKPDIRLLNGTAIDKNTATGYGGGIYANESNINIAANSAVYNNTAATAGDDLMFNASTFTLPKAKDMSGDRILSSDKAEIIGWYHDGWFKWNAAAKDGQGGYEQIDRWTAETADEYTPVEKDSYAITLKAAHPLMYTLTYNVTGDAPENYTAPKNQTLKANEKYTVAAVPESVTGTKDGVNGTYSFSGWKTADGTTLTGERELTGDVTLYGVWTFTKKSSSGGHRPSNPPVTIPDDVPTGLNGKDHYAYVVGYPDGMVYPQKNITRAEVATIFFRLLKDETREANMTKSNSYNDMKDGAWYTCAVSTLSKMGIIKGYEDGSFKPDASISRAEFAAIAARFDPDGDKTPATFSDVSSHWAKDEISIAANHGWIKGYEDGSFKPDQKITRAETMTLVNRVLKRLPETKDDLHKDMKTWPDNQNESAWFYLAVQEATNSHYQNLKKDGTHEKWESMRETRDWAALEK